MKKLFLFLIALSIYSVSQLSNAGPFVGPAEIELININANNWEVTAIKLVGVVHNEPGCNGNQSVAILPYTDPSYESFLSAILAAKMANKAIKIQVVGCDSHGYPLLRELVVE